MKFGQVWDLTTAYGELVVMLIADSDTISLVETEIVQAVILSGETIFMGERRGPGFIGPVKFGEGELRDA